MPERQSPPIPPVSTEPDAELQRFLIAQINGWKMSEHAPERLARVVEIAVRQQVRAEVATSLSSPTAHFGRAVSDWFRPCSRCGGYPGQDAHVAHADHPFEGALPPAVPSGPWPCCAHCEHRPPLNRHAYPCRSHQSSSRAKAPVGSNE